MKKIAIIVHDLYQEMEAWVPYYRLVEAGYDVKMVGAGNKKEYSSKLGYPIVVDLLSKDCIDEDFEGVIIPGGFAPDKIRIDIPSLKIVQKAFKEGKVVAAICHGPWVLVSAKVLKNKKATCYESIKDDLVNAGVEYLDTEVVVDDNLITSRTPRDIPAFCREIIRSLADK